MTEERIPVFIIYNNKLERTDTSTDAILKICIVCKYPLTKEKSCEVGCCSYCFVCETCSIPIACFFESKPVKGRIKRDLAPVATDDFKNCSLRCVYCGFWGNLSEARNHFISTNSKNCGNLFKQFVEKRILPIIVIVNFLEQRNLVPTSFKEAKKRKLVEVERLLRKDITDVVKALQNCESICKLMAIQEMILTKKESSIVLNHILDLSPEQASQPNNLSQDPVEMSSYRYMAKNLAMIQQYYQDPSTQDKDISPKEISQEQQNNLTKVGPQF